MNIKPQLLEYIRTHPGCSFVALERFFDGISFPWKGTEAYVHADHDHVVFWTGWNAAAVESLCELENARLIEKRPAGPLVYLMEGKGLGIPKIQDSFDMRSDRWLPVVFRATKGVRIYEYAHA